MSNSKLNKLKLGIKNGTEVTLNLSSNVIGDSRLIICIEFLLTDTQALRLRKALANNSSANIKLLKIQLSKLAQSRGSMSELDITAPHLENLKNKDFSMPNKEFLNILLDVGMNKAIKKINKSGSRITLTKIL